ncbi:MAG TPA: addiction module protein [Longimicrobium sp.]|nr:addiction module protein [Longimicrobium sp.]
MSNPLEKLGERATDTRDDDGYEWDPETEESDDLDAVESAWAEEIARRVEEIRNGTAVTYSLEEVLAELRERFG